MLEDDKPIGDYYKYKNGILSYYEFYWDDTTYVTNVEYDDSGGIKKDLNDRNALFNCHIIVHADTLSNPIQKKYEIKLIISNPPKCRTKVNIKFTSENGFCIEKDSILNVPFFNKIYKLKDSLKSIKCSAIQYDSIINKYYNFSLNFPFKSS